MDTFCPIGHIRLGFLYLVQIDRIAIHSWVGQWRAWSGLVVVHSLLYRYTGYGTSCVNM